MKSQNSKKREKVSEWERERVGRCLTFQALHSYCGMTFKRTWSHFQFFWVKKRGHPPLDVYIEQPLVNCLRVF